MAFSDAMRECGVNAFSHVAVLLDGDDFEKLGFNPAIDGPSRIFKWGKQNFLCATVAGITFVNTWSESKTFALLEPQAHGQVPVT